MKENRHWIHTVLPLSLIAILFVSAYIIIFPSTHREYPKGPPVIVDKSQSLNGKATYTYEGYGRREDFEDDFDKFSVGDTLPPKSKDVSTVEEIIDLPITDSIQ